MAQTKKRPPKKSPPSKRDARTWLQDHDVEILVVLLEAGRKDLAEGFAGALGMDLAGLAAAARAALGQRKVH